jgi:hypothetical protein
MTRWGYCMITGLNGGGSSGLDIACFYPRLIRFCAGGTKTEEDLAKRAAASRPRKWRDVSEAGYVAHVIAELGSEGWEMVGTGSGPVTGELEYRCIYFCRPIEGECGGLELDRPWRMGEMEPILPEKIGHVAN